MNKNSLMVLYFLGMSRCVCRFGSQLGNLMYFDDQNPVACLGRSVNVRAKREKEGADCQFISRREYRRSPVNR